MEKEKEFLLFADYAENCVSKGSTVIHPEKSNTSEVCSEVLLQFHLQ